MKNWSIVIFVVAILALTFGLAYIIWTSDLPLWVKILLLTS